MSFTGVTFAQQKVLPSDDAIIRRSLLSDGVLYGCDLSYSGSTLTMGAGQMLVCGRQIRHTSAQNWAVTDATSGFARLVIAVDLTRTASKEVFEQVVDSIQYATSQDGFPELNKSDVNTTGSLYQVSVCTVSLGAGGITGIVDQIGPCESVGGGGLNFKVVDGLTQPVGPAENAIWVKTDIPIPGYWFSATEPSGLQEGDVWILTGTFGTIAFNALKKNCIEVYPLSAKQYIDGELVAKPIKCYQGGEWRSFELIFFENGVFNTDVFGEVSGGSIQTDGSIKIGRNGSCKSTIAVDITNYSTFEYEVTTPYSYGRPVVRLFSKEGTKLAETAQKYDPGVYALDVSAINVPVIVEIYVYGNNSSDNCNLNHLKFKV